MKDDMIIVLNVRGSTLANMSDTEFDNYCESMVVKLSEIRGRFMEDERQG
jgi:hypothetical protein